MLDTRMEEYLDKLDPEEPVVLPRWRQRPIVVHEDEDPDCRAVYDAEEEPVVLPRRRGNVVLTAEEHAALLAEKRRDAYDAWVTEIVDNLNDIQRDLEHEDGTEDDDREERRWE